MCHPLAFSVIWRLKIFQGICPQDSRLHYPQYKALLSAFALLQKIPRLQRKRGKGRKSSTKSGLPEQCNIPGALLRFPGQNPRQKTDDNSPAKIRKKCPDRKVPLSRKKAQSITGRRPKGTSKCRNENLHLSSPSHLRIQYPPAACNSKNSGTRIRNFHFLVLW